ncbi:MAG: thiamine diphosphokinase [Christensenellales bacterium]
MRSGICFIVGAGEFTCRGLKPARGDLLLAADGGYEALHAQGLSSHLVIGDMDSLRRRPQGVSALRFPSRKDETDMALAIRLAQGMGFRKFRLYGATGGRQDHFQANLQLLSALARSRYDARIVAPNFTVYAIAAGTLRLHGLHRGQTVSVFCAGDEALGVTLRGLAYEITNARLTGDNPLGVSNQAAGDTAHISVRRGTLLAFVMRQGCVD